MLLLIEIILTIRAFKKGWGLTALLPLGAGFGVAFLIGFVFAIVEASPMAMLIAGVAVDLTIIAVLARMAMVGPRRVVVRRVTAPRSDSIAA